MMVKKFFGVYAFLLLGALTSCKEKSAENLVPDSKLVRISPEFEQFLIDTKIDTDLNPDGQIKYGEIKGIDSLTILFTGNGKSLEGLEYFTDLKYLKFTGYQQPTDATNRYYYAFTAGIVKEYIPTIDTLDVSSNLHLESLECSGNSDGGGYSSSIGHLKLGKNVSLKRIISRRCMMQSLDLSGVPNLDNLDILECYNLTIVSLCENTMIRSLASSQVREFYISPKLFVKPSWETGGAVFFECK
ncbi:hypothetical protein [Dyadobacter arcticus]|uniref:Lipoprotein n=1 Tax=Dyadobacter arcticus TaxID=1078754 RepID=A0ABX0UQG0_9BACT|nr:hypothetical protein [Dyadobacter arcticus]NIJ55233.1 hypothetical protein [Dyadobacter arcticus]